MSYNGSGTFNINSTGQPVVAGTVITASAFNALTTDLATGLTTAITKDGQTTTTARITFAQGITSSLVTDSSSVSTGSIITDGGVGIAKNLYVGGALNVTGATTFTNPVINNIKMGYTTTATAAGTTTLTVASNYRQFFTGTSTQTIVLPVTSTLVTGIAYEIENNSTGLLTVNSSGGNLVGTIPAGVCAHAVCIGTTLTTAADWDWDYISTTTITGTGANVLGTSPTITSPVISSIVNTGTLTLPTSTDTLVGRATTDTLTNKTLTTPVISSLSSASATALTLQSAGTTAITVDTSQNVGIGTSSPSNKLDVFRSTFGGSNTSLILSSVNSASAKINFSGIGYSIDQGSAGIEAASMYFSTYGSGALTERMRITSASEVLVNGTAAPVNGLKMAITNGSVKWSFGPDGSGNYCVFNASGTGVYVTNGGTSWTGTSDERLKTDLIPITNGLQKVNSLRSVTGRFKTDEEGTSRAFLIAQDVQAVLPEAVNTLNDEIGTLGLAYTDVIPLLVASIKELKAINDTQAETINALTARITALENA